MAIESYVVSNIKNRAHVTSDPNASYSKIYISDSDIYFDGKLDSDEKGIGISFLDCGVENSPQFIVGWLFGVGCSPFLIYDVQETIFSTFTMKKMKFYGE